LRTSPRVCSVAQRSDFSARTGLADINARAPYAGCALPPPRASPPCAYYDNLSGRPLVPQVGLPPDTSFIPYLLLRSGARVQQ
jgi:hypothetical protein